MTPREKIKNAGYVAAEVARVCWLVGGDVIRALRYRYGRS